MKLLRSSTTAPMSPKFHKFRLLLDENMPGRRAFASLNHLFDVKHIALDLKTDAIPNCVYWCRASKYGNVAWLTYGHERTGNHQAKCEVSKVLLTNQRMRAEKSQAVMRKGQKTHKNTPPPEPALKADCLLTSTYEPSVVSHREFVQTDILHRGPDDREATGLRCEHVDLIGALPHIAKEALNGIGRLNVPVHCGRKGIKRQQVLFILGQTPYRFGIAHSVLGFEGGQGDQCLWLCRLLPNANEFSLHIPTLSFWDSIAHIALLMHQTALTRGSRKQLLD